MDAIDIQPKIIEHTMLIMHNINFSIAEIRLQRNTSDATDRRKYS